MRRAGGEAVQSARGTRPPCPPSTQGKAGSWGFDNDCCWRQRLKLEQAHHQSIDTYKERVKQARAALRATPPSLGLRPLGPDDELLRTLLPDDEV
ncbi:uncharacterized protein STAUR_7739 [Stigmatella aurantiaca DW4/3-1]|uniref:Uncharacterized protein n=1 Tax=Stigmatella aurantiaca (strain DW4/3-1) TaxID=378806 RepID=E3FKC5_STIAD|nr:uncharacterized protein STAUR_7739 [Stigmatella aurantiaca DW4/3-1]